MNEPSPIILSSPDAGSRGAGDAMRCARQAQGMTLEALASMIKVTPAKLEALEQGRYDMLPDANFTRALAMTVCRALKMDPGEVLSMLPAAKPAPLAEGKPPLNQPFKEARGGAPLFDRHSMNWTSLLAPRYLAPLALLLGAVLIYFLPDSVLSPSWLSSSTSGKPLKTEVVPAVVTQTVALPSQSVAAAADVASRPSPQAAIPSAPAALTLDVAEPARSASVAASRGEYVDPRLLSVSAASTTPSQSQSPSPQKADARPVGGALKVVATETTWLDVRQADGSKLYSGHLQAGQSMVLDGVLPLHVHVGNVDGIQVNFKGQSVDLSPHSRNNVARIELK